MELDSVHESCPEAVRQRSVGSQAARIDRALSWPQVQPTTRASGETNHVRRSSAANGQAHYSRLQ